MKRLICVLLLLIPLGLQAKGLAPNTHKALGEVHVLIEQEDYQTAERTLKQLLIKNQKREYDQAVINQTLGYVLASQNRYKPASSAFQKAIDAKQLPDEVVLNLRYQLAQLLLASDQYQAGLDQLLIWFSEVPEPKAEAWALKANAEISLKKIDAAIGSLQKAILMENKESWRSTLVALHYQRKDYDACIPLLEGLIGDFPDKGNYWLQLSGVHLNLNNQAQGLALMELADEQGHLKTSAQRMQLAQLYLYRNTPYVAAGIIQAGLDNGSIKEDKRSRELLAESLSQAREHKDALQAWKQTVKHNPTSSNRLRLAELYFNGEQWQQAIDALKPVTSSKIKKHQARAWLLSGIAAYEQDDIQSARYFMQQSVHHKTTANTATQWLNYLNKQR